jgi:hypothetical protein
MTRPLPSRDQIGPDTPLRLADGDVCELDVSGRKIWVIPDQSKRPGHGKSHGIRRKK